MYRPSLAAQDIHFHPRPLRYEESCLRLLAPLTLWICVSVILRYGYFGDCQMVLGPSSSRLFQVNSVFIKQVVVKDYEKSEVFVYGFSEKPELSLTQNWSLSNYIIVAVVRKLPEFKGFSLWLNKGSAIRLRWEAQISSLGQLDVSLTKGEQKSETMVPTSTSSSNAHALGEPIDGREAEYTIEEDDKYKVGITNGNAKSVMIVMNLNVSSKLYDTRNAKNKCSTLDNGSCRLNLLFPNTHFVAVTTPNHDALLQGQLREWYVELSFMARVVTYVAILGLIIVIILIILKYLGAFDNEIRDQDERRTIRQVSETDPLMPQKILRSSYGTAEQDDDDRASSSSSEDLYDGKICVICYEEPRNCFFVPCGHCATCYSCAQRIIEGEAKVCPICRRPTRKVRKLLIP